MISMCATSRDLEANQRWATIHSFRVCSSSAATAAGTSGIFGRLLLLVLDQLEPVEAARGEREQVAQLADAREARAPEDLDRVAARELRQVQLHGLRRAR